MAVYKKIGCSKWVEALEVVYEDNKISIELEPFWVRSALSKSPGKDKGSLWYGKEYAYLFDGQHILAAEAGDYLIRDKTTGKLSFIMKDILDIHWSKVAD